MKKIAVIMAFLSILMITGCKQHESPVPLSDASYSDPGPGRLAFTPVNLHLCRTAAGNINGPVVINSQSEYDSFVLANNVYSNLTYTPAPYPVDYANKTLIGYIYNFIGSAPFGFKYDSIETDGKTTTVNVSTSTKICPGGPSYLESCATFFAVVDKTTAPVVFKISHATTDCDGNTTASSTALCPPTDVPYSDFSGAGAFNSATKVNVAVTTQDEYDAFISSYLNQGETAPAIDFTKKTLVAVFMGECPNICYSTDIESIETGCFYLTSNCTTPGCGTSVLPRIIVTVKETYPPAGAICGQAMTNPKKIVLMDKFQAGIQPAFIFR
jgi:hypothetical protein